MSRLYTNAWGARHNAETIPSHVYDEQARLPESSSSSNTFALPSSDTELHSSQLGQVGALEGGSSSDQSLLPTSKVPPRRVRNWSFTIFKSEMDEHDTDLQFYLAMPPIRCQYIVLGFEICPRTQREHYQGFVRFQHPKTFTGVKQLLGRKRFAPHIEQSAPSPASILYCKKGGNFKEAGDQPEFLHKGGASDGDTELSKAVARKRELYQSLKEGAEPFTLIDEQPEEYAFIHSISKYAAASRVRSFAAQVLYIHGTTGLGKTTTTQLCLDKLNLKYYKKAPGCKWFCGYNFERIIIFDEFASAIPLHRFNAMCDPKPPLLEIKGAQVPNAATHYIILSNRSPDDQYTTTHTEKPLEWDAYRRRITSTHHLARTHTQADDSDLEAVRADIDMIVSLFVSDIVLDLM